MPMDTGLLEQSYGSNLSTHSLTEENLPHGGFLFFSTHLLEFDSSKKNPFYSYHYFYHPEYTHAPLILPLQIPPLPCHTIDDHILDIESLRI